MTQQLGSLWTSTMSNFSSTLSKGIVEGQADWRNFAATAIESLVQVGIQEFIGLAIHQTIADKKKLTNAKSAFHGAYAATSDIPIIGPILAPIAGATAFAAVMAFRQGGIVTEDMLAMVHQNEMVLPAPVSKFVLDAASGAGGGGGHQIHIMYAPRVQAMDAEGFDRVFERHHDIAVRKIVAHLRRSNY